MSILETTLIFVVIPVVAIAVLYVVGRVTVSNPPPEPERFRLGDTWNRPPLLWSATDEVTPHSGHGGHADDTAHGAHAELEAGSVNLIGGRASGKW